MRRKQNAFTLIELIMAIVILGVVLVALGVMSIQFVQGIVNSRDLGIVAGLGKTEMAKINNLSYSDPTLAVGYDNTTADYEGYPYDLRRTVTAGPIANLKQVEVRVYPTGNLTDHLLNLITYVANVTFGAGSAGGAPAVGGGADFLAVSGGSISGSSLQNITLENTSSAPIIITGVIISFTGPNPGIKLNTITTNGAERWSGNDSSPSTITLTSSFTLTANATYNNTGLFSFSKNLTSVDSLVFIMSDGSETPSYSW